MLKKCPGCKETKSLSEYHYSSTNKNNVQGYCKVCMNLMDKAKRQRYRANGPTIIRTSKICLTCNVDMPISEFPNSKDKPDGHISYCKKCWTAYVKARKPKS